MIGVNDNKMYCSLMVFKFKNFDMIYPEEVRDILSYSTNSWEFKELEVLNTLGSVPIKRYLW